MTLPFDLNMLDAILLTIIAIFTIRGAFRGLLEEVTGLVGILAAIWLAGRYYPEFGMIIQGWTASEWSNVIAYVLILCGTLIAVSILSRLLHSFLRMAYADWLNHLAGAVVGALKGVALCAIVITLLGMFMSRAPFLQESRIAPPIRELVTMFKGHLPPDFFQR